MKDREVEAAKQAVEHMHGGCPSLARSEAVVETYQGQEVWRGIVHVFDLKGHPAATHAYAWSSPIEGSNKRRFYAVLHVPPVDSPQAAVRAAIVAEYRSKS